MDEALLLVLRDHAQGIVTCSVANVLVTHHCAGKRQTGLRPDFQSGFR